MDGINILQEYYKKSCSHPNKTIYNHIKEIELICERILDFMNLKKETREKIELLLKDLIFYHDAGKISSNFQKYLKGQINKAEHSPYSFFIYCLLNRNKIKKDKFKSLTAFLILKHHSYLNDNFDVGLYDDHIIDSLIFKIINKKMSNKEKIDFSRAIFKDIINYLKENFNLEDYLITLFAFGIFLLADRISASISESWKNKEELNKIIDDNEIIKEIKNAYSRIGYNIFQDYMEKLQSKNPEKKINELRTKAFKEVEKKFKENKNCNIFKITLPTGLGKTFIGLNVALLINQELRRPIIYSLPFLSIIEQNYKKIKDIFKEKVGRFHHLSIFENDENESLKDYMNFEIKPITITTLVQIFNSLITNNRNWIIKFPFIVTSILIIDETQNLPVGCFKDFEELFRKMSELFDTKIILMSATQPYLLEDAIELVENKGQYYVFNRYKIKVLDFLQEKKLNIDKFVEFIIKKLKEKNKVGIIVNKVKDSIDLFEILNKKLEFKEITEYEINSIKKTIKEDIEFLEKLEENFNLFLKKFDLSYKIPERFKNLEFLIKNNIKKFNLEGKEFYVLYLSANLVNLEKKIRTLILEFLKNKNLLVVSTQVIEAGVDIDLDVIFRYIAPLDSIIQSAGRVNRNGFKDPTGEFYIITDLKGDNDLGLYKHVYNKKLIDFTKDILLSELKEEKGLENELNERKLTNPKLVDRYFSCIRGKKECITKNKIVVREFDEKCISCILGNNKRKTTLGELVKNFNFSCIGNFSLIEDKPMIHHILDFDYKLLELTVLFYKKIRGMFKKEKIDNIKKFKKFLKIKEFFKASQIGKISSNVHDSKELELLRYLENNKLLKILESKKELKEENFEFYSLAFKKEKEFYYKRDKEDDYIFYDFFGINFKIISNNKLLNNDLPKTKEINKWEEEQIENFIIAD